MLDPNGDTGVYLNYAYVRICSILRRCGEHKVDSLVDRKFKITDPSERHLAMSLLKLPEAVNQAAKNLEINRITEHLYDTSQKLTTFYS